MAAVIAVTLASLAAFGLVTMQVVVVGVLASPVFLIATWTGSRYFSRSGDRLYRGASLAVLAATAIFILLASIS
jgi:hypothetical protein